MFIKFHSVLPTDGLWRNSSTKCEAMFWTNKPPLGGSISPISFLEGHCPSLAAPTLTKHPNQANQGLHDCQKLTARCVWSGLELNSAGTVALQERDWGTLVQWFKRGANPILFPILYYRFWEFTVFNLCLQPYLDVTSEKHCVHLMFRTLIHT